MTEECSQAISQFEWAQFWIAASALIVAALTLIMTIIGVIVAGVIANRQRKKEVYNYLLFSIALPYNTLETDILLLEQGTYDFGLTKDNLDKEAYMAISKAKSYSIITDNKKLFDYLDNIIRGTDQPNMGSLINEYFVARGTIVPPNNSNGAKTGFITNNAVQVASTVTSKFLKRVRTERDAAIKKIKKNGK